MVCTTAKPDGQRVCESNAVVRVTYPRTLDRLVSNQSQVGLSTIQMINSVWPNTKLANYWIKRAEFEKTNETFEDVIARVMKIRDFTTIYVEPFKRYQEEKLDTRMIEFDKLMNRRLFLANALLLRQNPSDIQKREKWEILHGN
ncbi:hypothetical protein PPACK8108_LOCUS5681 [Phakopsora pachyrhizi]|uniref:Pre-mRNA-splicing factor SYF1 central HAT repeats domain-containing protein n=1 Tax=Phakopsora pachyrhizi TaxID=170000 RepID=A0AAV0ARF3_PHAPC|nr:hypothetical protein PPACK8108_LOCUS5430 [Phakopsora pachyrhizi]CAH7670933.1 hypothetical protein PPACK8108_LOCUS5681 [Phakopsora pachyrhizi]